VFWVISVYFNIRNTLPKSGTFLLGHHVYLSFHIISRPHVVCENFIYSFSLAPENCLFHVLHLRYWNKYPHRAKQREMQWNSWNFNSCLSPEELFFFSLAWHLYEYNARLGGSVGIATLCILDGPRIEPCWRGHDFAYAFGPAPGPTEPPIQWVPVLFTGCKMVGVWDCWQIYQLHMPVV